MRMTHVMRVEMTNKGHMMRSSEMYTELRAEHDALTEAARPLVAKHLVLAFYEEGHDLSAHVGAYLAAPARYLAHHAPKIPRTDDAFNNWEGKGALCDAIILDTMMNVQNEMLGHDDSRADYMPDGLTQIQLLTEDSYDGNGFLWYCMNNLNRTIQDYDAYSDEEAEEIADHIESEFDAHMQDCSSSILYDLSVAFNSTTF